MAFATFFAILRHPLPGREFFRQVTFIARLSILPTGMLAIPFSILVVFTFDFLLFPGSHFPVATVLVVAATGATAVCAELAILDLGEQADTLRGQGVDPIPALVAPRVLAATFAAVLMSAVAIAAAGVFFFSSFAPHHPISMLFANLLLLLNPIHIVIAVIESAVLGFCSSLVACYRAISVGKKEVASARRPAHAAQPVG